LAYTGVIDERVDLALLGQIAELRPGWTIALVGPTAKIDASAIPARPNIVRCGQQPYDDLPSFLAACDVALVPFARNHATRAISPTKTLEYLAAGRPVVSTPVGDVVELYGDLVEVASDAEAFVAACERVTARSSAAALRWRDRVDTVLATREWDAIAAEMLRVMGQAAALRARREAATLPVARTA
jgi:UDP-galactopyranose mutase